MANEHEDLVNYVLSSPQNTNPSVLESLVEGVEEAAEKKALPPVTPNDNGKVLGVVDGQWAKTNEKAYQPFPESWETDSTTKALLDDINADESAVAGNAYLGEITCSDLPTGLGNVEARIEIVNSSVGGKAIHVVITSGSLYPYRWEYTYWNNGSSLSGWIAYQTEIKPNPVLAGTEPALSGLEVGGTKYQIPSGTNVVANPTLAGTEADLTGLQVGETKYKVPSGGSVSGSSYMIPFMSIPFTNMYASASDLEDGKVIIYSGDPEAITPMVEDLFLSIGEEALGEAEDGSAIAIGLGLFVDYTGSSVLPDNAKATLLTGIVIKDSSQGGIYLNSVYNSTSPFNVSDIAPTKFIAGAVMWTDPTTYDESISLVGFNTSNYRTSSAICKIMHDLIDGGYVVFYAS